jgi:hypothetical protein
MLKVVEKRDGREGGRSICCWTRSRARVHGECCARHSRLKSIITSSAIAVSVTSRATPWWCAMVMAKTRKVTLGAGTVELNAPRVNHRRLDQSGRRRRFTSQILLPYMRRSPKVAEVLPILYLRGLSTGEFPPRPRSTAG